MELYIQRTNRMRIEKDLFKKTKKKQRLTLAISNAGWLHKTDEDVVTYPLRQVNKKAAPKSRTCNRHGRLNTLWQCNPMGLWFPDM